MFILFLSCKIFMSVRGSPSTTIMSANLPGSRVPVLSPIKQAIAAFFLRETNEPAVERLFRAGEGASTADVADGAGTRILNPDYS